MIGLDLRFHRVLKEKIQAHLDEKMKQLAHGNAGSFEDYKNRTGYIRALNDVLTWCEDIASADSPRARRTDGNPNGA